MIGDTRSIVTLASCGILVFSAASPVIAEVASAEDMQRVIQLQQAQIEAQQAQLDEQRKILEQLQAQVQALAAPAPTVSAPTTAAAAPAPAASTTTAAPTERVAVAKPAAPAPTAASTPASATDVSASQSYLLKLPDTAGRPRQGPRMLEARSGHDLESPTGSNVSPNKPAISFQLPESATKVDIFGFTQFQVAYDTNYLNASEFDVFKLDVDDSDGGTTFSVNPSRFGFSSETNLGFGRINTLLTMDFNDELDEPSPRLRQAYGEFIQDDLDFAVLAGQAYTTGVDLKAFPETLDFAGPSGAFARRQALLRFTKLLSGREWLLDVALETPENATYNKAARRTRFPDLYVTAEWDARQAYLDHIRFMGLVRDLRAEDLLGNKDEALGWAVGASTKVKLPSLGEKDNLKLTVQYGEGYGAMLKSGPFDGGIDPSTGKLETVPVFSTFGGIQHFWNKKLRSNLSAGYVNADSPDFFSPDRMDNNVYVAANIIWAPFPSMEVGFEYLYGRRENIDGNSGDGQRFLFSTKYNF